ncbi:MAG TPA: HD domain-containing phosphohydrolase [Burkholderiaceae bacterium]|nr:HD domain-containing phosphohydrolase [Burkholderiaceae bacterium]
MPKGLADADVAMQQMSRMLDDLRGLYAQRKAAQRAAERAHQDTMLRLALAAEFRDDETGRHLLTMALCCEQFALCLGLPKTFARALRLAAPLHDVGKIGIPDAILKKAGPLSTEERAAMNEHTTKGAHLLAGATSELMKLAAEVALTHHERWDGSGYPNGLSGTAIPLAGRIVAVVDYFDALTMDRCYRKALPISEAMDMLRAQAGRALDPELCACFEKNLDRMLAVRACVERTNLSLADLIDHELCS